MSINKKIKNFLRVNNPKKLVLLVCSSFALLFSLIVSDFFNYFNYLEVFSYELIFPLVLAIITALIIGFAFWLSPVPKAFWAKLLGVILLSLAMAGFDDRVNAVTGLFRAYIPLLPPPDNDLPIISIVLFLSMLGLAMLVGYLAEKFQLSRNKYKSTQLSEFLMVVVIFVGLWQVIHLGSVLFTIIKESKVTAPEIVKNNKQQTDFKPDVYYIVLDRYTNDQVLENQFGYSNEKFSNFLDNNGFITNKNAYSNYPLTSISMSSTLNATYTNKLIEQYKNNEVQSRTLYHNLIHESSVVRAFKSQGYKYYHIGSDYGATNQAPLADEDLTSSAKIRVFGYTKIIRGFEGIQFKKSPLYELFKVNVNWWPLKYESTDRVNYIAGQFNALNQLAQDKSGGRFIYAHILLPHDPFTFNSDGSISGFQGTDNYGATIKNKYINQVQFANSLTEKLVTEIKQKSSDKAVIILNSDEGPYPHDMNGTSFGHPIENKDEVFHYGNMSEWPDDWLKMKYGILKSVYLPGYDTNSIKAEELSSVNLFRTVLNKYLGYNLEYLPDCNFALNRGDKYEYNYIDINSKLTGQTTNKCDQYQSIKN